MNMIVDCTGKALYIGDLVAFYSFSENRMLTGRIVRFDPTKVEGIVRVIIVTLNDKEEHWLFPEFIFKYAEEIHNCVNCLHDGKRDICQECEHTYLLPTKWEHDGSGNLYRETVSFCI